jgi:hypothetical protein
VESKDLTEVLFETKDGILVMQSPSAAEDKPRYMPVAKFPSRDLAMRFIVDGELT